MSMITAGNRLSLICFFLACFLQTARAETFAGWAESRVYPVPQIEVQAIDIQVPAILLTQLRQHSAARPESLPRRPNSATDKGSVRNLFAAFRFVKSVQPKTMEERMADNTSNPGSKDWDKEGQKKPDQKKSDQNQDRDEESENP
jgi:hypothetical protein